MKITLVTFAAKVVLSQTQCKIETL